MRLIMSVINIIETDEYQQRNYEERRDEEKF